MQEWKECVERCFFTDHLDRQLKEFLTRQKTLSSDAEYWEFLHKTAYEWEEKCSVYHDCRHGQVRAYQHENAAAHLRDAEV